MRIKGFLYAIISALFFGCAGLFVKQGYSDYFSPVDLLMLQYMIAVFILFTLCMIKYRHKLILSKEMLNKLLIQGVVGNTIMTVCYYQSFKYLDMAVATMLLFTYPAIVSVASFFIYKVRISKTKLMSIGGTFIGCILVLNIFHSNVKVNFLGVTFAILSAIFYSFMNLYAEDIVADIPGLVITFYTTIFSLLVLFLFNPHFLDRLMLQPLSSISNAAMLAFFCEIIPLTLLYEAIRKIGPVTTSIISSFELPASAVVAYIFLNEKLTFLQIVGILIVIYCVIKLKNEPQES